MVILAKGPEYVELIFRKLYDEAAGVALVNPNVVSVFWPTTGVRYKKKKKVNNMIWDNHFFIRQFGYSVVCNNYLKKNMNGLSN